IEVTVMLGGASGGNCAIGIVGIAISPARMMTSEQTEARIGRLMKVFTNTWPSLLVLRAQCSVLSACAQCSVLSALCSVLSACAQCLVLRVGVGLGVSLGAGGTEH